MMYSRRCRGLLAGKDEVKSLRPAQAVKSLGVRKPSRLSDENEATFRLSSPGWRQAQSGDGDSRPSRLPSKGREWDASELCSPAPTRSARFGLRALEEEHCIFYVPSPSEALLWSAVGLSEHEGDNLPLEVVSPARSVLLPLCNEQCGESKSRLKGCS
jgi:hypothetical protein